MPYISTTWLTGDTITAVLFNNCEAQYAAASYDYAPKTYSAGSTANMYLDTATYTSTSGVFTCIAILAIPTWVAHDSTFRLSAHIKNSGGVQPALLSIYDEYSIYRRWDAAVNQYIAGQGCYNVNYFKKGDNHGPSTASNPITELYFTGAAYQQCYVDFKIAGIKLLSIWLSTPADTASATDIAIRHDGAPVYKVTSDSLDNFAI